MALEEKDYKTAATEKLALEEEQRRQRRIRELTGEEWQIKYFYKTNFPEYPEQDWYEFKNNYWQQREERKMTAEEELGGFVFEER